MHAVWPWVACFAGSIAATEVSSHGGGLDAAGCHHVRKTGEYHCHRAPLPAPVVHERRSLASPTAQQPDLPQPASVEPVKAGEPHSELARCQAIQDPAKRLWCYDELAAKHKQ